MRNNRIGGLGHSVVLCACPMGHITSGYAVHGWRFSLSVGVQGMPFNGGMGKELRVPIILAPFAPQPRIGGILESLFGRAGVDKSFRGQIFGVQKKSADTFPIAYDV